MVDVIVRLTVLAVLALGALNALHAGAILFRLVRHVARRGPHFCLALWLPTFTSVADVRAWLARWGTVLADPAVVALRTDARTVVSRHLYLMVLSQTWAMAVTAVAPQLA
jgi:hypothetical protein